MLYCIVYSYTLLGDNARRDIPVHNTYVYYTICLFIHILSVHHVSHVGRLIDVILTDVIVQMQEFAL